MTQKHSLTGTVYLLHFERPLPAHQQTDAERESYGLPPRKSNIPHTAQHYLGFAENFQGRMEEHATGRGSRLTAAFHRFGIPFRIAQVWENQPRSFERMLKNRKHTARFCPICQQVVTWEELPDPLLDVTAALATVANRVSA